MILRTTPGGLHAGRPAFPFQPAGGFGLMFDVFAYLKYAHSLFDLAVALT
jgi:hypothetical protein